MKHAIFLLEPRIHEEIPSSVFLKTSLFSVTKRSRFLHVTRIQMNKLLKWSRFLDVYLIQERIYDVLLFTFVLLFYF